LLKFLRQFWDDEAGTTTIEYGLTGTFMAVIVITAFSLVGSRLKLSFGDIANNLSTS